MDIESQKKIEISRKSGSHFFIIILLISALFYVVPNISTNAKNYKCGTRILKCTRFKEVMYHNKNFDLRKKTILILEMTDGMELNITSEKKKYWVQLMEKENIGKVVKFYLGNNIEYGYNPMKIEINNKIIYDFDDEIIWKYLILIIIVIMIIYSFSKLKKSAINTLLKER